MKNNKITQDNKTFKLGGNINPITLKGLEILKSYNMLEDVEENGFIEVYSKHLYNNCYEVSLGCNEYLLIEGYENTISEATEQAKALIEDCGLNETLIFEAEIRGLINEEYFIDFWYEVHEQQAYNEDIEYIATNEELEQLEKGKLEEETIRENYFNSLQSSIKGEELEEYKFHLGQEEFYKVVKDNNLIDIDKLAQWCVEMDGVGHYLSYYDGEELEHNNIFLYRVN